MDSQCKPSAIACMSQPRVDREVDMEGQQTSSLLYSQQGLSAQQHRNCSLTVSSLLCKYNFRPENWEVMLGFHGLDSNAFSPALCVSDCQYCTLGNLPELAVCKTSEMHGWRCEFIVTTSSMLLLKLMSVPYAIVMTFKRHHEGHQLTANRDCNTPTEGCCLKG